MSLAAALGNLFCPIPSENKLAFLPGVRAGGLDAVRSPVTAKNTNPMMISTTQQTAGGTE
jgi:hypothetical protein